MYKTETILSLVKIANVLDHNNYIEQSDSIDKMIVRLADEIKIKREIELLNNPYAEDFESEEEAKNIAENDFIDGKKKK